VRQLFESPTLASLGELIEKSVSGGRELNELPIEKPRRDEPLPLSFAQQRLWFIDQLNPGSAAHNIPLAVRLPGSIDATHWGRRSTKSSNDTRACARYSLSKGIVPSS
jgi:hypothetical protein